MEYKFERRELKYHVKYERLDALRQRFLNHMAYDPFCRGRQDNRYSVRSIYFDTSNYLFYYEKVEGLKVRKKLRVRTYNLSSDNVPAFLEIKRKYGNIIYKERAVVALKEVPKLTNGANLQLLNGNADFSQKSALDKFIYLTKRLNLKPQSLITYEREAFVGIEDPALRVTFDLNVRSYPEPAFEEIYREDDLREIEERFFVLEIKLNSVMPGWTRGIIRDFNLHQQSISKYCNGIDVWRN
ncbi:MAG: polyphosphate polymerase domain-containing protein [FCB group bacterium]|nr:polyphosphate polymerase domain-containing protein [FCB group bacterium]